MRIFFGVMLPESNKSLSRQGLGHPLTQRVAMLSLFSTGLLQSMWICSSHPQYHGHHWSESASSGPPPIPLHQSLVILCTLWNSEWNSSHFSHEEICPQRKSGLSKPEQASRSPDLRYHWCALFRLCKFSILENSGWTKCWKGEDVGGRGLLISRLWELARVSMPQRILHQNKMYCI